MPARAKERKTGGTEEDISILPRKRKRMKNDQPPVSSYGRPNIALGAKAAAHHKIATYRTHGHIMSRLQKRRGFRVCMSRLIVFSPKTYTKEFPGADSDLQSTKDILYSPPIYRENQKNQEASSHNLRTERKKNKQTRADRKEFPAWKLEPPKKFMRKMATTTKKKERKKVRKSYNMLGERLQKIQRLLAEFSYGLVSAFLHASMWCNSVCFVLQRQQYNAKRVLARIVLFPATT